MKKGILLTALMGVSVLFVACGGKEKGGERAPIQVKTQQVGVSSVYGKQAFSGTIEEVSGASLSFATSGTLKQLNVVEGQTVRSGQLIGVVDATTAQNAYTSAQASLRTAQDSYDRNKQLHDKGSLPEQQWVQAQSQLEQALAMEQIAKKSLGDTRLFAPFSGYVAKKSVEVGQNIMQGQTICKIVRIDQVKVKISVPEDEISKIKKGQQVEFTVAAVPGRTFTGTVTEKGVSADAQTRSYEVRALVQNGDHALLPGMVCTLKTDYEQGEQAIFLPANLVQLDSDNRTFVWLAVNGQAKKTYVTTGEENAQGVIVLTGLNTGDNVIVKGQQKVSEGTKIEIKK